MLTVPCLLGNVAELGRWIPSSPGTLGFVQLECPAMAFYVFGRLVAKKYWTVKTVKSLTLLVLSKHSNSSKATFANPNIASLVSLHVVSIDE